MKRLFFALWPDEATRQRLLQLSATLQLPGAKRIRPENLHVTLAFLGNVDEQLLPALEEQVEGIPVPGFSLLFDQLDYWRRPGIVCLTCSKPVPQVLQLAQGLSEICSGLGITLDGREFRAHVTLARHVRGKPEVRLEPLPWPADDFVLVESQTWPEGVQYTVLRRYPFCQS